MSRGGTSRLGLAEAWGSIAPTGMRFNQDASCFAVALDYSNSEEVSSAMSSSTAGGLRIFNVDPIRELGHFSLANVGTLSHAEMLFRTNLVAIVSGGRRPIFSENSVLIYDTEAEKIKLEFTLNEKILAVRLKRDKLIAVCRTHITVFSFPHNPKKLFTISTRDNVRGLCEVSPLRMASLECKSEIMVFPGYKCGSVQIVDLATTEHHVSSAPVTINAHRSELWCIAINQQGTRLATASSKGTLIRIWDPFRRIMLVELRRGTDQALLYCISFSPGDDWLCCSSDKGTVHIFALQDYRLNKRSALASIGVPGAYAGSQWSLASFTVPQECACICAFGPPQQASPQHQAQGGSIYAACLDGSFHNYHFGADGKCNQAAYDVFTEMCEDCGWEALRQ